METRENRAHARMIYTKLHGNKAQRPAPPATTTGTVAQYVETIKTILGLFFFFTKRFCAHETLTSAFHNLRGFCAHKKNAAFVVFCWLNSVLLVNVCL